MRLRGLRWGNGSDEEGFGRVLDYGVGCFFYLEQDLECLVCFGVFGDEGMLVSFGKLLWDSHGMKELFRLEDS